MGFFENRYKIICPDFAIAEERPALRVNTKLINPKALVQRLEKRGVKLEKVPFLDHGYYYESEFSLGSTEEYLLGYYYLQGAASQIVAEVLPTRSGLVLDAAAAPGGKTTHLAQLSSGNFIALDTHSKRLQSVRNNCSRLMLDNVAYVNKDARYVNELGLQFDAAVLDAPCSGNFCSEEGWFHKRTLDDVKKRARVQRQLVAAVAQVVKPGGYLLYSTCSLEPEEDELVVDWALRNCPLELVETKLNIGDPGITSWENKELPNELKKTRRFWPHKTHTEGFFIALFCNC